MRYKVCFWIELVFMIIYTALTICICASHGIGAAFIPIGAILFYFEMRSEWKIIKKGCEYCQGEKAYGAVSFPVTTNGKVSLKNMEAVEANFCPICGKKLKALPQRNTQGALSTNAQSDKEEV